MLLMFESDAEKTEAIHVLRKLGLRPIDVPAVTQTNTKDEWLVSFTASKETDDGE